MLICVGLIEREMDTVGPGTTGSAVLGSVAAARRGSPTLHAPPPSSGEQRRFHDTS
jgi:hypothetical protein